MEGADKEASLKLETPTDLAKPSLTQATSPWPRDLNEYGLFGMCIYYYELAPHPYERQVT